MNSIFETKEPPAPVTSQAVAKTAGAAIEALCWIATIVGCSFGLFILLTGMMTAQSAPQEAVVVAISIACCVIPYCIARAIHHLRNLG